MPAITIEVSDDQLARLRELAAGRGETPEEFVARRPGSTPRPSMCCGRTSNCTGGWRFRASGGRQPPESGGGCRPVDAQGLRRWAIEDARGGLRTRSAADLARFGRSVNSPAAQALGGPPLAIAG